MDEGFLHAALPEELRIGGQERCGQGLFHFRYEELRRVTPFHFGCQEVNEPFQPSGASRTRLQNRKRLKMRVALAGDRRDFASQKRTVDAKDQILNPERISDLAIRRRAPGTMMMAIIPVGAGRRAGWCFRKSQSVADNSKRRDN